MKNDSLPEFIDIAIVGAGPHALALVAHLLQKKKSMRGRFLVFDPSGTWMSQWNHHSMIQQARNGGSMTPAMLTQLRRLERDRSHIPQIFKPIELPIKLE